MQKLIASLLVVFLTTNVQAQVTDTLGWATYNLGTETLYTSPNGGFAFGNNGYSDRAKAQTFYNESGSFVLKKALLKFGDVAFDSQDSTSAITVNVYDNTGPGITVYSNSDTVAPNDTLATMEVPIFQLLNDGSLTEVDFSSDTLVFYQNERFSIGIDFGKLAVGDTVGLSSTSDEDAQGANNSWELTFNNQWIMVAQPAYSWNLDVDLAIFAEIDENDPAGIFETQDKAQELDVFPNPAGSLISIRGIEAIRGASYSIEVYNASGQLVQTHLSTGLSLKTIDVSNLPPGFYLLKVLSENLTAQSRFIKM